MDISITITTDCDLSLTIIIPGKSILGHQMMMMMIAGLILAGLILSSLASVNVVLLLKRLGVFKHSSYANA